MKTWLFWVFQNVPLYATWYWLSYTFSAHCLCSREMAMYCRESLHRHPSLRCIVSGHFTSCLEYIHYAHTYIQIFTHMHIFKNTYSSIHTFTYIYAHASTHLNTHRSIHIYIHIYTQYIFTHVYTYIHKC